MSDFCKARKGDTALVCFISVITTKDFKTSMREYYKFCSVAHCDRKGKVVQVLCKGDNYLYPATYGVYMIPLEKCGNLNLVHFLGNEQYATPQDAVTAINALIEIHKNNQLEGV